MEIIIPAAACVNSSDAVDVACTAANADLATCNAATATATGSCVWKGPGDAYAGAYT